MYPANSAGGVSQRLHFGYRKELDDSGALRESDSWLDRSLALFQSANAVFAVATVWSELAVCHLGLGNDAELRKLLEMALEVNRESGTVHNYQGVLARIGNVYLHRGDYLRAIDHYRHALEVGTGDERSGFKAEMVP